MKKTIKKQTEFEKIITDILPHIEDFKAENGKYFIRKQSSIYSGLEHVNAKLHTLDFCNGEKWYELSAFEKL